MDDELKGLKLRRLKAFTEYHEEEKKLRKLLEDRLGEIDAEVARLLDANQALPCLVRKTPGPDHTVYHSADATCGRVRARGNFKEVDEWIAMEEGDYSYYLNRCSACDWDKAAQIEARRRHEGGD